MSLKLLLKVNRLCSTVDRENFTVKTEKSLVDVLVQIINSSHSSLLFSIQLNDLIDKIKERCNSKTILLIEQYQTKLKLLLDDFGLESLQQLSPESISLYYDRILSKYEKPEAIDECYYRDIYKLVIDRDLLIYCRTDEYHYVQPDIIGSLYSVDPELLPFHEKNKLQHLRDVMMFKFNDYKTAGTWQYTFDRCKNIIQSHILESENDVDIGSDAKCKTWLSELESDAYWTIRWWVIYSMFLTGEYSLVVTNFLDLLTIERTQPFIHGDSVTALKNIDSEIIDVKSLLRIVYLSVLASENNIGENKVFKILSQSNLFETDRVIKRLRDSIHVFQMQIVQELFTKIEDEIPWIEPLSRSFDNYRHLVLQKTLLTYLSCTYQTTYVELSQTFDIEIEQVKLILRNLLALLDLPFVMDKRAGVIYYASRGLDMQEDKIQASIRDEIIRYNKTKINRIISATNEADTGDH